MKQSLSPWIVAAGNHTSVAGWLRPLVLLVCITSSAFAQFPVAGLHTIFPPGAKSGTTIDVTITGQNLEGKQKLLFSHAGIMAKTKVREPGPLEIGQKIARDQFAVTVASNVPPGNYDVRVQSKYGVSNARTFVVGTFDEVTENVDNADPDATNHSREQAVELKLPMTANGRVDGTVMDYYKFVAKQGQRVIVDCSALRIESSLAAVVTLMNAHGSQLARDRGYHNGDALVDFIAPADGEYFIGVRAVNFAGKPVQNNQTKAWIAKNHAFFYRLTISTGPFIDSIFPPSGAAGASGSYTLYGRNLPGAKPAKLRSIDGKLLEELKVNIPLPSDATRLATDATVRSNFSSIDGIGYRLETPAGQSNLVLVSFARAPVVPEQEPNDKPDQAQQVTLPCELVGRFFPRTDQDWATFDVKKDQTYWVEVISNRLGLPVDPAILIQRYATVQTKSHEGNEEVVIEEQKWLDVLAVDDVKHPLCPQRPYAIFSPGTASFLASTYDAWGSFTAPEDGTYRVMVRLSNPTRDDPRLVYRLILRSAKADFRLVVSTFHFGDYANAPNGAPAMGDVIYKGAAMAYQVTAFRRDGFADPIEVVAEGLPPGVTCPPVVIGTSVHTVPLVLFAAENAAPWSGKIRVVGKALVDDKPLLREARGATVGGITRLTRDGIRLTVIGHSWPYSVTAGEGRIWETARNGKLEIPYKISKHVELLGDVGLKLWGPPWRPNSYNQPRITQKKVSIANGKVTIEVPPDFPPGTYSFFLNCSGKIKYSLKPETLEAALARQKELEQVIANLGARADADAKALIQQAKTAKQAADKLVEDTKKKVTPKDVNLPSFSTPITIKIHPAPFVLPPIKSPFAVRQGNNVEIPVAIQRLIGYAGPITLGASFPDVKNIKVMAMPIAPGQVQSKVVIEADVNATPGKHKGQIIARMNFNGQEQTLNQSVVLTIEEVKTGKE